jgi:PAS domain S-box-containing protein
VKPSVGSFRLVSEAARQISIVGKNQQFSPLLESIDRAVIATGPDRRIVYWNTLAERLYGWTADEVYGKDILEITPFEAATAREITEPLENGGNWSGEFTLRRKDGSTLPAFVSITTIRDEAGAPAGVLGLSYAIARKNEDGIVTDRPASTIRSDASRSVPPEIDQAQTINPHHEVVFENMSEGVALCEAIRNRDGHLIDYVILAVNPALQGLLGVGPEVVGTKLSDTGDKTERWLQLCDNVLRTGEPKRFEFENKLNGRWHNIQINRVSDDRMAQFFCDITDKKLAEARQQRLAEELNHRVKNNLAMVAAVLRMQAKDAHPEVREQLLRAVGRVQSISEVYRSLLVDHRRSVVNFGAYLEELCASLAASLVDDPGRVILNVEAQPAEVSVDTAVPLGMVVNELVTNAVKYAYPPPERGQISVRFKRWDADCMLEIGDSGAGLPQISEGKSLGHGMKLVQALVQQVGGQLETMHHPGVTYVIRFAAA